MAIIYRDAENVEVVNTTTETEIFSFDLADYSLLNGTGILGSTGHLRVTVLGLIDSNATGTKNASFKGVIGTRSLGGVAADIPTGFPYFKVSFTILNKDVVDEIITVRELSVQDTNYTGSSEHASALGVHPAQGGLDLNTDTNFSVKVTLSQAATNFKVTKQVAIIEEL